MQDKKKLEKAEAQQTDLTNFHFAKKTEKIIKDCRHKRNIQIQIECQKHMCKFFSLLYFREKSKKHAFNNTITLNYHHWTLE